MMLNNLLVKWNSILPFSKRFNNNNLIFMGHDPNNTPFPRKTARKRLMSIKTKWRMTDKRNV